MKFKFLSQLDEIFSCFCRGVCSGGNREDAVQDSSSTRNETSFNQKSAVSLVDGKGQKESPEAPRKKVSSSERTLLTKNRKRRTHQDGRIFVEDFE